MALFDEGGGALDARGGFVASDFWVPPSLQDHAELVEQVAVDFWQPPPRQATATTAIDDFWWPVERAETDGNAGAGPEPAIPLPAFDPNLADELYRPTFDPPTGETIAGRRARWLVQGLDIPEAPRRRRVQHYFAELFSMFPSPYSFRALMHLATEDGDAESLVAGCQFKEMFIESTDWQWRRSAAGTLQVPATDPAKALSWARARRLAQYCGGDDPSSYIDIEWLEEWRALRLGDPCYFSYLDYIEDQLKASAGGLWTREPDLAGRPPTIEAAGMGATYGLRSILGARLFGTPEPGRPGGEVAPIVNVIARRNHGDARSGGRLLR